MGKTPGKWIKNFLLGKKSSKSSPSKGSDVLKTSNKREQVISCTKLSISDPKISSPIVCNNVGVENSQSNEVVCMYVKEPGSSSTQTNVNSEETEKLKLDQAATKAQAAFRGFAARREFRSQKCIIMLQAQIRGHLVRRQAVSTLCCVNGVVKFQALVRSRKEVKSSNSPGKNTAAKLKRPRKSSFVYKLRASLPSSKPLQLQYNSENPNFTSLWLDRWTKSRFWDPPSERKKNPVSKPRKTEPEQDKPPKKTPRRLSSGSKSNAENGSAGPALDSEKGKPNPKKAPANTLQEHSPNKIERPSRFAGKSKERTKKASIESLEIIGKGECIEELSRDLDILSIDNQRQSERRASLPANFDPQENNNNNNNTPKRPSYMAQTESAKAKLKAQGSPRFSRDVAAEKNAFMRRHSLSSSTNSLLSSSLSPRAHRLVQSAGKGVLRGDRSFSSSRDGGDKLIQAEWRR